MKLKLLFSIACSALCASCTVGPDFEKPEAKNIPEEWSIKKASDNESIAEWWKLFGDEKLSELVERALENNYDMRAAASRIQQARASLGISVGGWLPVIDANGSISESGSGGVSANGSNVPTSPSYNVGAGASWEIDVFGGTRRGVESYYALYEYSLADKCATRLAVAAEVAQNYFQYRALQRELSIVKFNLETQKRTLEVIKSRKMAGLVSELDLARSAAQVASTSSEIPSIESQLKQTQHALEYLLATPVGSLEETLKEYKELPSLKEYIPSGVPADLLERRPDIIMAELKYHSAFAKIGEAYADFFPKFSVAGNISYTAPDAGNILQKQYGSWSVGPTVSWNIFNAFKTLNNVRLQKAVSEEAGISWESTVQSAIKEVEDYLIAVNKEVERLRSLDEVVKKYRKSFELSKTLYQEGEIEFLDLLDAQRSMLSAERTQTESMKLIIVDMILLYKALGGGWDYQRSLFYEDPKNENLEISGSVL